MNEEQAFVQAIDETPLDPLPRLIYADWLEDQGDPRAEWLRLDCQLRDPSQVVDDPAADLARFRELTEASSPSWLAELIRAEIAPCQGANGKDCPRQWRLLTRTPNPLVRWCHRCDRLVFLCLNRCRAVELMQSEQVYAIDPLCGIWISEATTILLATSSAAVPTPERRATPPELRPLHDPTRTQREAAQILRSIHEAIQHLQRLGVDPFAALEGE